MKWIYLSYVHINEFIYIRNTVTYSILFNTSEYLMLVLFLSHFWENKYFPFLAQILICV
jgi:hypothetical protein